MAVVRSFTRWKFTGRFMPYGAHSIEVLARFSYIFVVLLPIFALVAFTSRIFFGHDFITGAVTAFSTRASYPSSLVTSKTVYLAIVGTLLYSLSFFKYNPLDRDVKNYYNTSETPTYFYRWERLAITCSVAVIPVVYFTLLYFDHTAIISEYTGLGPLTIAFMSHLLPIYLCLRWTSMRYRNENSLGAHEKARGIYYFQVGFIALYLMQIPLGNIVPIFDFDLLLIGSSSDPVVAAFYAMLLWMLNLARHLRYTVYEDAAGFERINPTLFIWGIVSRAPLAFVVCLLWFGSGIHRFAAIGLYAPFFAVVGYQVWRFIDTPRLAEAPSGGPGKGTRYYEKNVVKPINEGAKKMRLVEDAVSEYNEFAAENQLKSLPSPREDEFSERDVRKTLKNVGGDIRENVPQERLDEVISTFRSRRDAVLEALRYDY